MSDEATSIDYLISLYNGHLAIAERADVDQLRHIHVKTCLDDKILEWLQAGQDVILTGNPGDGKTHLLRYLDLPDSVESEPDASQRQAEEILKTWRRCRRSRKQFLLAINHAPLRHLAKVAAGDTVFNSLHEMVLPRKRSQSIIDNFVVYSEDQELVRADCQQRRPVIKLVDLSQREILTEDIVSELLNKLCHLAGNVSCATELKCSYCPLRDNSQALSHKQVQKNVVSVLSLVARHGFHTTMRDLVGLLAFILTGGANCQHLWNKKAVGTTPHNSDYAYFNLLFEGRSSLFDALRHTFDPGLYSDPRVDLQLWGGSILEGWLISRSVGSALVPIDLVALKSLKRRYFLEHSESTARKRQRMITDVEQQFDDLLEEDNSQTAVQELVEMINLFYAPLSKGDHRNYRDRLYLWNQHRYSIGQAPGYFAMRSLSSDQLSVYLPRLNCAYEDAIAVRQDHVLLAVKHWLPGAPALRIDWEMYKALWDAKQGKTIEAQPYSILRRLDLFLRSLSSETGNWAAIETIQWSDYRRHTVVSLKINRKKASYQE